MKKLFCLLLVFAIAIPVFAEFNIRVTGTPPTSSDSTVNGQLKTAFDKLLFDLSNEFNDSFSKSPDNLLRAMGNSSVYASHGATTRGYGGYKIFSATVGPMYGFQLPKGLSSFINDGIDTDTLQKEGDINFGVSPNLFNVNVGLSMGIFKFLPENLGVLKRDNLYIGLRAGYLKIPEGLIKNFSYSSLTLGLTVNYQIVPSLSLVKLITWRGVNLGSGFIYNGSKSSITILFDPINEQISPSSYIHMIPKASTDLDIKTFTIPLEVITSIKLLIFNIPFGLGADLAFGKTSLGLGVASDMEYINVPTITSKGNIFVKAEASNIPSIFNFKIMTGIGIIAGPVVVIDVPITFYPANKGYSFGITMGALF